MKKTALLITILLSTFYVTAQSDSTNFFEFPKDWVGNWSGTLEIYGVDAVRMHVPMQLEIQPIDSTEERYTWGLVYNSKKDDFRPYELVLSNKVLGLWHLDEKNSIVIESYVRGNAFTSWFVVEGNRVLCIYERTKEGIEFRVVAGVESPISTTGEGTHEGEKISKVDTYPATTFQHALLTLKEEK